MEVKAGPGQIGGPSKRQQLLSMSYFHTFKAEVIHGKKFKTQEEAEAISRKYITFYNQERLHSSLGYTTPEKYAKLET